MCIHYASTKDMYAIATVERRACLQMMPILQGGDHSLSVATLAFQLVLVAL